MDATQLKLLNHRVVYYCVNPKCFYEETILDFNDIVWKDRWCKDAGDLQLFAHCPSCGENLYGESEGLDSSDYDNHKEFD